MSRHPPPPVRADGFRLPGPVRLGPVRLQIADLDRSLSFYERVLGCRVLERSAGAALLGAHGAGAPLVALYEHAGARPPPPHGRLGLYHYAILLPDRAALGRFSAHLRTLGVRPGASDHLVSEALYQHDPDGLGIEVYADRPRTTWQYADGELQMDTRPLDLDDVVRAARGEPWDGMPKGTVIGHVHLHVGSMAQAARFYHAGLGLDKVVWSYPGALFLSAGGYHHHLGVNTWAAGAAPAGDADARLLEWELIVPAAADARAALDSIEAAGFAVERTDGDGGSATDPWGVRLRVRGAA